MPLLVDLPGTSGDKEADLFYSATAAVNSLRAGRAATAAGDNGAINVWKDDAGNYRVELMRYRSTVMSASLSTLRAVRAHVKEYLALIQ